MVFLQSPPALENQYDDDRVLRSYLRRALPEDVLNAIESQLTALGELAAGPLYFQQLEERGLEPPREWTGRHRTRLWVHDHGFPADWAGFPGSSRAAVEVIDGPAILSPLHDYQDFVTDRIKSMLRGVGNERAESGLAPGVRLCH